MQLFDTDVIDIDELLKAEQVVNQAATIETVTQKYLAMCLVMNANRTKCESLWNKLENDLLMNSYSTTLRAATYLLTNGKVESTSNSRPRPNGGGVSNGVKGDKSGGKPQVSFAQLPQLVPLPSNGDFSALA